MKAVAKENDQKKLAEIVKTATLAAVRLAGVQKLTDPRTLSEIALGEEMPLSEAALDRLKDPVWLASVVRRSKTPSIRMGAARKINDEESLAKAAAACKDESVFLWILQKLTDQKLIEKLVYDSVLNGNFPAGLLPEIPTLLSREIFVDMIELRNMALKKITDPALLLGIATDLSLERL